MKEEKFNCNCVTKLSFHSGVEAVSFATPASWTFGLNVVKTKTTQVHEAHGSHDDDQKGRKITQQPVFYTQHFLSLDDFARYKADRKSGCSWNCPANKRWLERNALFTW